MHVCGLKKNSMNIQGPTTHLKRLKIANTSDAPVCSSSITFPSFPPSQEVTTILNNVLCILYLQF